MIYFCIFVLVGSTAKFALDMNTLPCPDPFRLFMELVSAVLAIAMLVNLTW